MGKASKWFRAVLGLKKTDPSPLRQDETAARTKEKRRWSFVKSYREKDQTLNLHNHRVAHNAQSSSVSSQFEEDPNRHAIAVAAAKADVAEKAVVAANAAAEAVRLMSSGRCAGNPVTAYGSGSRGGWREDFAAVKIQSAFRGYLARRALRALKALVRLQALVRGHIQRKQMAKQAQWMQALLRVQARARAGRSHVSGSSHSSSKSFHSHHPRTGSKSNGREIGEEEKAHASFNWSERLTEKPWEQRAASARTCSLDDEKSDKILEVDTVKPHFTPKQRNLFRSMHGLASEQYSHSFTTSKDSTTHHSAPSPSSGEVQSTPLKFTREDHEEAYRTAENSPQFYSASSKGASGRSPFTPSKSDGSASFLSGYSDYCPNYMSYTESSKAKLRSLSAPKQRPQYERSSSAKRHSMNGLLGEPRSSSAQRASTLRASFTSKAYPGSGRLDRLGMPIGQRY
ncbi:protein IQ-DOMAIN 22 isoform X2 [Euphorbia lathyris]|uniref:protein IQ-DOMAIN 22 isoform X2 n=1 Tax=Euphorbia lathyris TaxID=212925 RepID=UPI00331391A4